MKLHSVTAFLVIPAVISVYYLVSDITKEEPKPPVPTCTLSTEISDTETVYQIKPDSECELMKKNKV